MLVRDRRSLGRSGESRWLRYDVANAAVRPGLGLRRLSGGMIKPGRFRTKPTKVMLLGVFATFKELCNRGLSLSLGEVRPADVHLERDACAEHFGLIGEGLGLVADRAWDNVPSYSPVDVVWGAVPAPNELHAALRQMSLGKAAAEDEVTAELLKFGGANLWDVVVRVCREQWLLLTEAAPVAVVWPEEWCIGLVVPLWKRKGQKRTRTLGVG